LRLARVKILGTVLNKVRASDSPYSRYANQLYYQRRVDADPDDESETVDAEARSQ
jgi:hypothetical protein